LGLGRNNRAFLDLWGDILQKMSETVPLDKFTPGDRSEPFCMTDQDALCMAAMVTPSPLSVIGPEGMDFVGGGFTMSHATGSPKPWRKKFARCAWQGRPPSRADKGWLANCSDPIQVLTPGQLKAKRRDLKIGSALGRLIRRA
jgi:hypothetical protein